MAGEPGGSEQGSKFSFRRLLGIDRSEAKPAGQQAAVQTPTAKEEEPFVPQWRQEQQANLTAAIINQGALEKKGIKPTETGSTPTPTGEVPAGKVVGTPESDRKRGWNVNM